MEKFKVTIKLIDVSHDEWASYVKDLIEKFNIKIDLHIDTYWCLVNWDVYQEILLIADIFKANGKTIIVKKEGL